jgi:hypothetical protein
VLAASAAATVEIVGKSLVVMDSSAGTDATRRRVSATAKQRDTAAALLGDPRASGAAAALEVGSRRRDLRARLRHPVERATDDTTVDGEHHVDDGRRGLRPGVGRAAVLGRVPRRDAHLR